MNVNGLSRLPSSFSGENEYANDVAENDTLSVGFSLLPKTVEL